MTDYHQVVCKCGKKLATGAQGLPNEPGLTGEYCSVCDTYGYEGPHGDMDMPANFHPTTLKGNK